MLSYTICERDSHSLGVEYGHPEVRRLQQALKDYTKAAKRSDLDPGEITGFVNDKTVVPLFSVASRIPRLPDEAVIALAIGEIAYALLPESGRSATRGIIATYANEIAIGVELLTRRIAPTTAPTAAPAAAPTTTYPQGSISRYRYSQKAWYVFGPSASRGPEQAAQGAATAQQRAQQQQRAIEQEFWKRTPFGQSALGEICIGATCPGLGADGTALTVTSGQPIAVIPGTPDAPPAGTIPGPPMDKKPSILADWRLWAAVGGVALAGGGVYYITRKR